MADPQQVLAARARLALRAERAFGVSGVRVKPGSIPNSAADSPADTRKPARDVPPNGSSGRPTPDVAGTEASSSRPASKAKARGTAKPTVDLFGNPIPVTGEPETKPAFDDPPPPRGKRIELLQAMDDNEVKGCTKCELSENRTHTVFGEGDPEADLVFIGEGPGENEDLSGRPFVGKAGGLLEKMINGMGLKREDVYIANVVKCRPPGNRAPTAGEVAACTPYLDRQLELIRPKVVVTLGLPASRHLLGGNLPMGRMRGQWHDWRGLKVMPTYHPAYLLRSYTEANRRAVWGDLQMVMDELGLKRPG